MHANLVVRTPHRSRHTSSDAGAHPCALLAIISMETKTTVPKICRFDSLVEAGITSNVPHLQDLSMSRYCKILIVRYLSATSELTHAERTTGCNQIY